MNIDSTIQNCCKGTKLLSWGGFFHLPFKSLNIGLLHFLVSTCILSRIYMAFS